MTKEKILTHLKTFNYDFKAQSDRIVVKLGYCLEAEIEFDDGRIVVKDKLKCWNFLTGVFEMSLKGAMVFNTIFTLIIAVVFVYMNFLTENTILQLMKILAFVLILFWILLWSNYYHTKFESFRNSVLIIGH